jgi:murein DD-endopeptidase MepM/ murein hydrolase activator NlpD
MQRLAATGRASRRSIRHGATESSAARAAFVARVGRLGAAGVGAVGLVARAGHLGVAALVGLALVAPAAASAQSGGAEYRPAPWLEARAFEVTPASIAPGATVTVRFRVDGRPRRMRVRVDLLPEAGGPAAATLRLGRRSTGRLITASWRPELAAGRYTARLRATVARRRRTARASELAPVEVVGTPVAASTGVFPVQGEWTMGGDEARFGAQRPGHAHQGQDIFAAEGTPVVSPRAGFVSWRAYQAAGAGHYVVVRGDDARDYVFMHLQDGSVAVQKGQAVAAGERLGAVGATGRADGPHLHFEIWPDGWYEDDSEPIDPISDLLAWAGRP